MKLLQDKVNVDAPDADYPFGKMRDDQGSGNGTPADTDFMNDYTQFFEKMFNESGVVANGLPDNDYTGFQLYEALRVLFPCRQDVITTTWNMDTTGSITVAHGITDFTKIRAIEVMVVNNALSAIIPLRGSEGNVGIIDSTIATLSRNNAGFFDSASFNAATIYMTVSYVD